MFNNVFNKIIKNLGYEFDTPVIDFNKMINLKYKEEIILKRS